MIGKWFAWFFAGIAFLGVPELKTAEFFDQWAASVLSAYPLEQGSLDDPDGDNELNLTEFTYGTNATAPLGIGAAVQPLKSGSDGVLGVELFQRAGRRPGIQIDLDLSADLSRWTRPWWQRAEAPAHPLDPPGSLREVFTTRMPATQKFFVKSAIQMVEAGPEAANYHVATDGSDTAAGSSAKPFATLARAVGLANPGDLIYVRGGTYLWADRVRFTRSGTAAQPIRVRAYPGERPVLDFSAQIMDPASRGLDISGSYWHLHGLEVVGSGDNGINLSGAHNVVEQCITRGCRDTGLHISPGGSYNLVLNCDSYRNYDPATHGENADGFTAKTGVGPGNVFRGCRAWENADDGFDLWQATEAIVIENCWAFRNGINFWGDPLFTGNANGFKLGGNFYAGPHRIAHCLAFDHRATGFDQNNNTAGLIVVHNTAWGNLARNFNFSHGTTTQGVHQLRNNLSIGGSVIVQKSAVQSKNSWQLYPAGVTTSDVLSAEAALALTPRRPDGGLPETPFLRPLPDGRLVDKGEILSEPFSGSAPDLGAFETPVW